MMKNVPLEVKLRISQQLETGTLEDRKASIRELARFPVVMQTVLVPYLQEGSEDSETRADMQEETEGGRNLEIPEESVWPLLSWQVKADGALWEPERGKSVMIFSDITPISTALRREIGILLFLAGLYDFALGEVIDQGTRRESSLEVDSDSEAEADGVIKIKMPDVLKYLKDHNIRMGPVTTFEPLASTLFTLEQTTVTVSSDSSGRSVIAGNEDFVAGTFEKDVFPKVPGLQIGHIAAVAESMAPLHSNFDFSVSEMLFTLSDEVLRQAVTSIPANVVEDIPEALLLQTIVPFEMPAVFSGAVRNGKYIGPMAVWNSSVLRFIRPTLYFRRGQFIPVLGGILQLESRSNAANNSNEVDFSLGIPVFKVLLNSGIDCQVRSVQDLISPCVNLDVVPKALMQYVTERGGLNMNEGTWYLVKGVFPDGISGAMYFFVPNNFLSYTRQLLDKLGLLNLGADSRVAVHNLLDILSKVYFEKRQSFARLNSASEAVSA